MIVNRRSMMLGAAAILSGQGLSINGFGITEAQARLNNFVPTGSESEPFELTPTDYSKIDPEFHRKLVPFDRGYRVGTIVVDPHAHHLYHVRENGTALRYGVSVGRAGFEWQGKAHINLKRRWPSWHPPAAMRERQPELPISMPGGPDNPLGARALYLFQDGKDTLYRIHGTNKPQSIGTSQSSGCIRMLNEEIIDLYRRVPRGSTVVVL